MTGVIMFQEQRITCRISNCENITFKNNVSQFKKHCFILRGLFHDIAHSTALLSRMFIFLQLLPRLITLEFQVIALEFLIKQILQPAGTPPFLQNLVALPVRHAELEHEGH